MEKPQVDNDYFPGEEPGCTTLIALSCFTIGLAGIVLLCILVGHAFSWLAF